MAKSIYITGGEFGNKGAEAMVLAVAREVVKYLPSCKIYVSIPPRDCDIAVGHGLIPVPTGLSKSPFGRFRQQIGSVALAAQCDALIDVSGFQFGDAWGPRPAQRRARTVRLWQRLGRKVVFMPQAWGPFTDTALAEATRRLIRHSHLTYVRDAKSMAAVDSLMDGELSNVRQAHDIAWTFDGAPLAEGRKILSEYGVSADSVRKIIGITPNIRVYERSAGTSAQNSYIRRLRRVVEHLLHHHRAQIVLIGHELRVDAARNPDDRFVCDLILNEFGRSGEVVHLDRVFSADEVKGIIGNFTLLISSRYHALIGALSQGIPALAAGWSHKYEELMSVVGNELRLESDDGGEPAGPVLDEFILREGEYRARLAERLPTIRLESRRVLEDVVREVVGS